jgi:hypothetical protein
VTFLPRKTSRNPGRVCRSILNPVPRARVLARAIAAFASSSASTLPISNPVQRKNRGPHPCVLQRCCQLDLATATLIKREMRFPYTFIRSVRPLKLRQTRTLPPCTRWRS